MNNSLYSINYVDILSTSSPMYTMVPNVTAEYCKTACNNSAKCNGYSFVPTFSLTCTVPSDVSTCTKKVSLAADGVSEAGNCYSLISSTKDKVPNPLYIKNVCSGYSAICESVWTSHFNAFYAVIIIILMLNVYLVKRCIEIRQKYYRNTSMKVITFYVICAIALIAIIAGSVAKANVS